MDFEGSPDWISGVEAVLLGGIQTGLNDFVRSQMSVFKNVARLLNGGESVVLATVLDRSGSAPRSAGSRMAVCANGSSFGTVGGGILEARVRELAADVFKSHETMVTGFSLSDEDASMMGMVCGGKARVIMHFLDASESGQNRFYQNLATAQGACRQGLLITRIPPEAGRRPENSLLCKDGFVTGTLDPAMVRELAVRFRGRQPNVVKYGREEFLVEPLSRQGSAFIFGAGHIGRELAPLVKLVGFRTIVLDDRQEFASRVRFPNVDSVRVIDSFETAMDKIDIEGDGYIVIATRGHAHDKAVLGLALATEAAYIGMVGSKTKRDAIYEKLLEEGFTAADLKRVHCPIGLDIGAETPEEIALSIVAELVQVRAAANQ